MSCLLEPAIWPHDTGQRIPCLDRCQLIVTWLSNIKEVHSKPRLYFCQPLFRSMAAMLRDSVVVVRTRPRAIPLATRTMGKSTHGFPFLSHDKCGAPLGGPSRRRSSAKNSPRSLGEHARILEPRCFVDERLNNGVLIKILTRPFPPNRFVCVFL